MQLYSVSIWYLEYKVNKNLSDYQYSVPHSFEYFFSRSREDDYENILSFLYYFIGSIFCIRNVKRTDNFVACDISSCADNFPCR